MGSPLIRGSRAASTRKKTEMRVGEVKRRRGWNTKGGGEDAERLF